jgi:Protein of unknown function (DUF3168)
MLEQNIASVLTAQAAITSLAATRVYPIVLPTDPDLPALTYQIVGGSSNPTLSSAGMQKIRLQIDCWGDSYGDAVTLRDAVATSLSGYQDANVQFLFLSKHDDFDHELLQYRAIIEFYIFTISV